MSPASTPPWMPELCRLPRLAAMLGLAELVVVVLALAPDVVIVATGGYANPGDFEGAELAVTAVLAAVAHAPQALGQSGGGLVEGDQLVVRVGLGPHDVPRATDRQFHADRLVRVLVVGGLRHADLERVGALGERLEALGALDDVVAESLREADVAGDVADIHGHGVLLVRLSRVRPREGRCASVSRPQGGGGSEGATSFQPSAGREP